MKVRHASEHDLDLVVDLVSRLLVELGGEPLRPAAAETTFRALVSDSKSGFILLGERRGQVCAVCTVSFVRALRSHGPHAIIQEMYVDADLRSTGVGERILRAGLDEAASRAARSSSSELRWRGPGQSSSTSETGSSGWCEASLAVRVGLGKARSCRIATVLARPELL